MDLIFQKLVLAVCGTSCVILFESEYACCRLFRDRTSLFFFVCQLAILSSAIQSALISLIYFVPELITLPILIRILLIWLVMDISCPMMILLRLRILYTLHLTVMCIPIIQSFVWIALKYFLGKLVINGKILFAKIQLFCVLQLFHLLYKI